MTDPTDAVTVPPAAPASAPTESPPAPPAQARTRTAGRGRRVLAILALILACVTITVSTVAVWTHQVALKTDRFTALVADVVDDPAVIDPLAARVSTQVIESLDVEGRIAAALPGPSQVLAPAITNAVREAIEQRLQVALADPRVQDALLTTISFTHERLVRLLRDEGDAVTLVDGYVYVNVFPIVGTALAELQSMGIIPASVTLPDLSSPDAPDALAAKLEAALGVTLPDDFGTVKLMPAARLETARTFVKVFDLIVVVLIVLSILLVALALWLATSRRKMALALAIGTIISFLIARLALNGIRESLLGAIEDEGLVGAVRSVGQATLEDLRSVTIIVLVGAVIIAIVAYVAGRPAWLTRTAGAASGVAAGAASSAAAGVSSGAASVTGAAPSKEALAETARANRVHIERVGLVAIGFIVLWIAIGLEVALLGLALVIGWELIMGFLSREPADEG